MNITLMQSVMLPLNKLRVNDGQVPGLPANPRRIDKERLKKLKESIKKNPEMLAMREILVYEYKSEYIVIGGNQRIVALQGLRISEVPCKIIPSDATPEQLRAYLAKDNISFGEWVDEMLTQDWNLSELDSFGMEDVERLDLEASGYISDNAEEGTVVMAPQNKAQHQKVTPLQQHAPSEPFSPQITPPDDVNIHDNAPEPELDETPVQVESTEAEEVVGQQQPAEQTPSALANLSKKKYKMEAVLTFTSQEMQDEYFEILVELKQLMPQYETIGERVLDALRFWRKNHG